MIGPDGFYVFAGDNRDLMANMGDNTVDAVVTDGPYELVSIRKRFGGPNAAPQQFGKDGAYARAARGFMGQTWDGTGIVNDPTFWAEVLRVLKPGGFLLSFGGTRTYHRMACAIEDAGFEIRDMISWLYGSGFPKGSVVEGRGPAMKPAQEPVCMARKPFPGSIARNMAEWGTGALRIDDCRVGTDLIKTSEKIKGASFTSVGAGQGFNGCPESTHVGRFPANVMHDGSDEVVACFPADAGAAAPASGAMLRGENTSVARGRFAGLPEGVEPQFHADAGSAARFFYQNGLSDVEWLDQNLRLLLVGNAEHSLRLQSGLDAFAQSGAVISLLPAGSQLSVLTQLSMSVTPTQLRLLATQLIETIQTFVNECWREWPLEGLTLSPSHVHCVARRGPTGITLTMPDLLISFGCVEPVIFSITSASWEAGAKDYEPSTGRPFYCAKASKTDREEGLADFPTQAGGMVSENSGQHLTRRDEGYEPPQRANVHPTVKPEGIMRYLVRLVTPPGGLVFDPFAGSGSTGKAAVREGMRFLGAEMTAEYVPIARARIAHAARNA